MTQTQEKNLALPGVEDLREEILRLAKDTSSEKLPPLTGAEEDEELERRETESVLRRALSRYIWCRLSAEQKRSIRSAILKRDPGYASCCGTALDWECLREIERVLEGSDR